MQLVLDLQIEDDAIELVLDCSFVCQGIQNQPCEMRLSLSYQKPFGHCFELSVIDYLDNILVLFLP
jgi:hypothetical protein